MAKQVRELMTSNPSTVEANAPIVEAARLMRDEDIGIVPIVEGERLVGIITRMDILALHVISPRY